MEEGEVLSKIEKLNDFKEIHDFIEGDSRKSILAAVSKKILRLRGGVTCEDMLKNLREKGYKV